MKPEAQRIAIAEFCGWRFDSCTNHLGTLTTATKSGCGSNNVPDYLNDLNAMHEAENHLKVEQIGDYENRLYGVTDFRDSVKGEVAIFWSQHSLYRNIHATAAQRAEALLRTIGKWTE